MQQENFSITTVYFQRDLKTLFNLICEGYGSSASAVLRDFIEHYCKTHYLDFIEDPIFMQAACKFPPERDFIHFAEEVNRLQTEYLKNKYKDSSSKKQNTLKLRYVRRNDVKNLFESEGDEL